MLRQTVPGIYITTYKWTGTTIHITSDICLERGLVYTLTADVGCCCHDNYETVRWICREDVRKWGRLGLGLDVSEAD